MKVAKLKEGEQINVGDMIRTENLSVQWWTVHRVTKNYAFVRYNEYAEGKFPRVFKSFGFGSLPRPRFQTTSYSPWRPTPVALGKASALVEAK